MIWISVNFFESARLIYYQVTVIASEMFVSDSDSIFYYYCCRLMKYYLLNDKKFQVSSYLISFLKIPVLFGVTLLILIYLSCFN